MNALSYVLPGERVQGVAFHDVLWFFGWKALLFFITVLFHRDMKEIHHFYDSMARSPPSAGQPPNLTCMVMSKGVAASWSWQGWNMAREASTRKMRLSRPENPAPPEGKGEGNVRHKGSPPPPRGQSAAPAGGEPHRAAPGPPHGLRLPPAPPHHRRAAGRGRKPPTATWPPRPEEGARWRRCPPRRPHLSLTAPPPNEKRECPSTPRPPARGPRMRTVQGPAA